MYKAFWGIMGALTVTFLVLLGIYLNKNGVFEKKRSRSLYRLRKVLHR